MIAPFARARFASLGDMCFVFNKPKVFSFLLSHHRKLFFLGYGARFIHTKYWDGLHLVEIFCRQPTEKGKP